VDHQHDGMPVNKNKNQLIHYLDIAQTSGQANKLHRPASWQA